MISPKEKQKEQRRHGHGTSRAAIERAEKAHRGKLYTGRPGDTIQMSDRSYFVAKDGSFRSPK